MSQFPITSSIPFLEKPPAREAKYPWAYMSPGDSFFAPEHTTACGTGWPRIATAYGRKCVPGSVWRIRTVVEDGIQGVRVWRIS